MAQLNSNLTDDGIAQHHISGDLTLDELLQMVLRYDKNPKTLTLWDISAATPIYFSPAEMDDAVDDVARYITPTGERKTAWVGTTSHTFGTVRMMLSFLERERKGIELQAFNNLDAALIWLRSG